MWMALICVKLQVKLHLQRFLSCILVVIVLNWWETEDIFLLYCQTSLIYFGPRLLWWSVHMCSCALEHLSMYSVCHFLPGTYLYVRVCVTFRKENETEWNREKERDICRCPLEGTRRPAWFFIRFSGLWCCSCCLLLYQLLNPLMQPGIDSGRLHVLRLWLDLQRKSSETFDAPSAIFPVLSYRRPLWWVSWQRLHCLAWGHFVSCCLGQFNWEANLLPLLLIDTQHPLKHIVLHNRM